MYFTREFPYIFVYCFSCRYLVELGLRQLGLPVLKQKLCSAENAIFKLEKKQKLTKNRGLFANMQRGVLFFVSLVVLFVFLSVFVLLFRKGYFPCSFGGFFLFCSPKGPVFKILLFFLFCFSFFSPCLPFQNSIFSLLFFCHQPFFGKRDLFLCLLSCFFAFSLLMFACFIEAIFLTSPFGDPCCFHFQLFLFSSVVLVVCFHGVCFCLSVFFMLALFWACFLLLLFCFRFVSCFCFQTMKIIVSLDF